MSKKKNNLSPHEKFLVICFIILAVVFFLMAVFFPSRLTGKGHGSYSAAVISTSAPTCTSFGYSSWSPCINYVQTRTVTSSSPRNCTGGSPSLSRACTPSGTKYSVSYKANGGNGTSPTDGNKYYTGYPVTVLGNTNLTKSGYIFAGWNTQSNGLGTTYAPASTFTMGKANVTLYAKWGTIAPPPIVPTVPICSSFSYTPWTTCANDSQIRSIVAASPEGCTGGTPTLIQSCTTPIPVVIPTCSFSYTPWTTCANDLQVRSIVATSPAGCVGGIPTLIQSCVTPITYRTVTFDANGGAGSMSPITLAEGASVNLTINTLTNTGYTFAGWSASTAGSVTYTAGSSLTVGTSDITLYAVWNLIPVQPVVNAKPAVQITNCVELQAIKSNATTTYELANDIDCTDTKNWNSGAGFKSIGATFIGNLDGKGHSIFNLYINTTNSNGATLFGYNKGKISNLNLVDFNISGASRVASLVSVNLLGGEVSNCYADGVLKSSDVSTPQFTAMLVSSNAGTVTNSRIKTEAPFRCIGVSGTGAVGGCTRVNDTIVNPYKIVTPAPSRLSLLVSQQTEVVINPLDIQTSFSSLAPTAVTNCTELQNIQNSPSESYYLANDIDCTNVAFVPIDNFSGLFDGNGFVIKNVSYSYPSDGSTELFNVNSGLFAKTTERAIITNVGITDAFFGSAYYTGTLVGDNGGTVSNSYAIKSQVKAQKQGAGGLVGVNNGLIMDSYSSVVVWTGRYNQSSADAGGLVGINNAGGVILNSYSAGGEVDGWDPNGIGGLVGSNLGLVKNSFTSIVPYYSHSVNSAGPCGDSRPSYFSSVGIVMGGLIGVNNGKIETAQWIKPTQALYLLTNTCQITGNGSACANPASCVGQINTSAFFSTENPIYKDWDFVNAWKFNAGTYPTPRVNKLVDINNTDYYKFNNVENLTLRNDSGQITFTEPVTASGTDLYNIVSIYGNYVEVKSGLQPALNKPAIITLLKVIVPNGDKSTVHFVKDGTPVNLEILNTNPLTFKMNSFSSVRVSITSTPCLTRCPCEIIVANGVGSTTEANKFFNSIYALPATSSKLINWTVVPGYRFVSNRGNFIENKIVSIDKTSRINILVAAHSLGSIAAFNYVYGGTVGSNTLIYEFYDPPYASPPPPNSVGGVIMEAFHSISFGFLATDVFEINTARSGGIEFSSKIINWSNGLKKWGIIPPATSLLTAAQLLENTKQSARHTSYLESSQVILGSSNPLVDARNALASTTDWISANCPNTYSSSPLLP